MKLGGLLAIIFGPISIDTERARPSNVKFTCQIHKEKNTLSAEKSFMCKLRLFRHCSDFCRAQAGNHHLPLKTVGELLQDGLPPVGRGRLLRDRDHKMGLRWTQLIDRNWSIGAARAVFLDQLIPSVPTWGWLMSSDPRRSPTAAGRRP